MRALFGLAVVGAIAAALASAAARQPATAPAPTVTARPTASARPTSTATPAPPALPDAAINRQDRTSRAHGVREARAYDRRPLLTVLPARRAGVRIDLRGLTPDDARAVLSVDPGARSRAHAREVLDRLLREHDDPGSGYRLVWAR